MSVTSALPIETKTSLFETMLYIRLVEEAIVQRYSEQKMRCPVHLCIGQEAVASGVCHSLDTTSYAFSTHRAHGHYLAKGGSLERMIAEIYGKLTGCAQGRGGSMHLVDIDKGFLGSTPIVGGSLPVAVGSALASKMQGKCDITAVFFGEGMTEEGVFSESLNFAALHNLPVLFVCENNLYSVYSPMHVRQPAARNNAAIAAAHGVVAITGNGNNVEEVYIKATEAKEILIRGNGPVYLEFTTYRWREHCGPNYDNNIGYRTEEEFLAWQKSCPIASYTKQLMHEEILNKEALNTIQKKLSDKIERAFAFAETSPFPPVEDLQKYLYAMNQENIAND